jgi:gliding motility-associated-like protein
MRLNMNLSYLLKTASLVLSFVALLNNNSFAQSFGANVRGGEISYVSTAPGVFDLTLNVFYDCPGSVPSSTALVRVYDCTGANPAIFSLSSSNTAGTNISDVCTANFGSTDCNSGTIEGKKQVTYTGSIDMSTFTTCNFYQLRTLATQRGTSSNMIVTGSSALLQITQDFYLANDNENNSVVFGGIDLPYVCASSAVSYDPLISDPDDDSLVVSLVSAMGGSVSVSNVTYTGGASGAAPISGITIDANTGVLNFTAPSSTGNYNVVYRVDEYDRTSGLQVGTSHKEISFYVDGTCSNTAPAAGASLTSLTGSAVLNSNYSVTLSSSAANCFTLNYTDADGIATYTSNATTALTGATFNAATGQVCWTPATTDIGTHYITIGAKDNACNIQGKSTKTIEVVVTSGIQALAIDSVQVVDETCTGASDGQIEIFISGGVGPFTYELFYNNPPPTTLSQNGNPVFTGLPAPKTYAISVIDLGDANNTVTSTASVAQGSDIAINAVTAQQATCFGACTGNGLVTTFFSSAGTSYLWSTGETTAAATNGTCELVDSVNIAENTQIVITVDSTHDVSCNGLSDGDIFITPSGGSGTYSSYAWSSGSTVQDLLNQPVGSYEVIVTDNIGCKDSITSAIAEPVALSVTMSSTDPLCNGASSGTATATPAGGTAPYTYLWNDAGSQTSQTATALPSGNVSVTVTDANGCTISDNVTLADPTALTITFNKTDVLCFGDATGAATATANNATGAVVYNWDNGTLNNASITSVLAGTYEVTATDANGCSVIDQVIITQPSSALTLTVVETQAVNCTGGSDGIATATGAGGTAAYTYAWPTSANTTGVETGLSAGSYIVTVTDNNNCQTTNTVVITEPANGMSITFTVDSVNCNSGADGAATVNVTGGTTPYASFAWNNGAGNTQTVTGLSAGITYSVTVTDNNGCTVVGDTTIPEPAAITGSILLDSNVSCNGGSDGGLTVQGLTGGTGTYSYLWSNGATTASITGVSAGVYNVTVTDINGCTAVFSETITEPTVLSATIYTPPTIAGFTYIGEYGDQFIYYNTTIATWAQARANALAQGGDLIVISNAIDQAYFASVLPSGSWIGLTDEVIEGTYVWVDGTVATFFNWNAGEPNNLGNEDYIQFTGGTHVWNDLPASSTLPYAMSIDKTSLNTSNVSCFGGNDGEATVTAAGGTTNYFYLWDNGQTTVTATGLIAGSYIVTVTDANGCTATDTAIVTEPTALTFTTFSQDVSCFGGNDGIAAVIPAGGTSPYFFNWSNGGSTDTITALIAGSYDVTITDDNGCQTSTTIVVDEPLSGMSLTFTVDSVNCNASSDGGATVNVLGGTTPYTSFVWDNGAGNTQTVTGLSAGITYNVTVTDNNGCTVIGDTTIPEPAAIAGTIVLDNDVSCNGLADGGLTIQAITGGTGSYTYLWSGGTAPLNQASVSGLSAGTYDVTVTDANLCTQVFQGVVSEPTAIALSIQIDSNTSCNAGADGSLTAIASGGTNPYTFLWSNADADSIAGGLAAGTYDVTLTDANGCTATATETISEPTALAVVMDSTDITCAGNTDGTATATPAGGTTPYTYAWSNGGTSAALTGLSAGTYNVTVTDGNGCQVLSQTTVNGAGPAITFTIQTDSNVSCFGLSDGSLTVINIANAASPYSFAWSNGDTDSIAGGLSVGTYDVTLTDNNGCTATQSAPITEPTILLVSTNVLASVQCAGDSTGQIIAFTNSGGTAPYSFAWSEGSTATGVASSTLTLLPSGSYTVTLTDANGCTSSDTRILNPGVTIAMNPAVDTILCNGVADASITLNPTGGTTYSYAWSIAGSTNSQTNLAPGTYSVTVTDNATLCSVDSTFVLTEPSAISLTASGTDLICYDDASGTATANATGGTGTLNYSWSNGDITQTITGLDSGQYTVTVTDQNLCTVTDVVDITQPAELIANASITTEVSCNGESDGAVSVNATGGTGALNYTWSNGTTGATATTLTAIAGGTYTVTITDASLCETVTAITLVNPTNLYVSLDSTFDPSCTNDDGRAYIRGFGGQQSSASTSAYEVIQNTSDYAPYGFDVEGSTKYALGDDEAGAIEDIGFSFDFFGTTFTEFSVQSNGFIKFGVNAGNAQFNNVAIPNAVNPNNWVGIWDDLDPSATTSEIIETYLGGTAPNRIRVVSYQNVPTFNDNSALVTFQIVLHEGSNIIEIHTQNLPSKSSDGTAGPGTTFGIENSTGTVGYTVTGRNPLPIAGSVTNDYVAFIPVGQDFDFAWPDGGTDSVRTDLAAGSYIVTITDPSGNGCFDTVQFVLDNPDTLDVVLDATPVTCAVTTTTVSAIASNGSGNFSFSWNTGAVTASITGMVNVFYEVTVTDLTTGCEIILDTTLTTPAGFTSSAVVDQDVSCFNGTDGQATVTHTATVLPITITWSSGGTAATETGLAAGNYNVIIVDGNGCSDTSFVTIDEPATAVSATLLASSDPACNGGNDGFIAILASGGTPNYFYTWSPNVSTSDTAVSLSAGIYSTTITDANGCNSIVTNTLVDPTALSVSTTSTNSACFGPCDGTATATASGGTSLYTYTWNTGASQISSASSTITNLCGDSTYSVTVVDANGCSSNAFETVSENFTPNVTIVGTDATCATSCDGTATASSPFCIGCTIEWKQQGTTTVLGTSASITGLCPGLTYQVTYTTIFGCSRTETVFIDSPPALVLAMDSLDATCGSANGSAIVNVIGGTLPYSFAWSGSAVNNDTLSGVGAGMYYVTVTDGNNCITEDSVQVIEPSTMILTFSALADATCQGGDNGTATVNVAGGTPNYTYSWDNGESAATAVLLDSGEHYVTVTDANLCSTIDTVVISDGDSILIAVTETPITCAGGGNDGVLVAAASGGDGSLGFTYSWNTGATTAQITGLTAGTYTVIATDVANGCQDSITYNMLPPSAFAVAMIDSTDVLCNGDTNGTALVEATSGSGNYSYAWSNGETNDLAIALWAGFHQVIVTDLVTGCIDSASVTIDEPTFLVVAIDSVDTNTCFGGTDGIAYSSITGGTTPYTIAWPNGSDSLMSVNLAVGSYEVTVTDFNGCVANATAVITQPVTGLSVIASVDSNVRCFGFPDGGASAIASGGSGVYQYNWTGGSTSSFTAGLSAGQYIVTVTDGGVCNALDTVVITEPSQLAGTITETQSITCIGGGNDGELTALGIGGTAPYTYEWNNAVFTDVNTGLTAGTYFVTITDFNNCSIILSETIANPTGITLTMVDSTDVLCLGDANGTAEVQVTGGSGNYTYAWDNAETNAIATALNAGSHFVTVTDVNTGCTANEDVIIGTPLLLTVAIDSVDTNTCFGGTDGIAYSSIAGGTAPYIIAWPNGSDSLMSVNLAAGSYEVTVTDFNGCVANATAVITQPVTGLSVTASVDSNATCFGLANGGASAIANGGSGVYQYNWTGGLTGASITGLAAGQYIVTVTDGGVCFALDTITITAPSQITATDVSNISPTCPGGTNGSAEILAAGGTPNYTYEWPSGTIGALETGLSDGTYPVTITDVNGCEFIYPVTITDPAAMNIAVSNVTNTGCGVCAGGATLTITNGTAPYTYLWANGETSNIAIALCAGANGVTVTDFNNCTASTSVNINSDGADTVVAGAFDALCFGEPSGKAFGTYTCPGGGCSIAWFDIPAGNNVGNGDTLFNVTAGLYIAQLTNGSGCVFSDTAIVGEPTPVQGSLVSSTDANCFGGSDGTATVTASGGTVGAGGYTFIWDNTEVGSTASALTAGLHVVTISDQNGCQDTVQVTISQPATGLSVIASVVQDVSCNGGSDGEVDAIASGGSGVYNYQWNGALNGANQTNLSVGTYIVIVDDGGICFATDTVTVIEPAPIVITIDSTNSPTCPAGNDGNAGVTATGGTAPYNYAWSNGNTGQVATGLAAGTYDVTVNDFNNCSSVQSVTIFDPAGIVVDSITGISNSSCTVCDGSATVNVSGGTAPYAFTWSNLGTGQTNTTLCGGINFVTITDANLCQIVQQINVLDNGADTITADSIDASCGACDGQAIATYDEINGTGPFSVYWTNSIGDTIAQNVDTLTNLCAGTYTATLVNGLGCTWVDNTTVNAPDLIDPQATFTDVSCFSACDATVSVNPIGGSGSFSYAWDNGAGNVSSQSNLCAGTYIVTITDIAGCDTVVTFNIIEPSEIFANATVTNASCGGTCDGSILTSPTPNSGTYTFNWSPVPANGNGSFDATGLCAGTYFLTITNQNGCLSLDTFVITEPTPITLDSSDVINASCGDTNGVAFVQAIGGTGALTYNWSNGDTGQTADSLMLGLYDVTVSDASGCSAILVLPVSEDNGPTIDIASINVSANGATDGSATVVVITAQGNTTYAWSNGDTNQTADTLAAGFYSVTVTDSAGCSAIDTVTITEPAAINISFAVTDITCTGGGCDGIITATVVGGVAPYNFAWSNGDTTATIDTLCAGSYILTVTDANGVTIIDSVELNDPTPFTITPAIVDATCNGSCDGSVALTIIGGSGNYDYLWSTGDTTNMLMDLCAGQYTVTVTDNTGCLDSLTITIGEPAAITVSIISVVEPTCPVTTPDGSIEVAAAGGNGGPYAYQWLDDQLNLLAGQSSNIATGLTAGIYNVAVVDQSTGCADTTFIILNNDNAADIALDSINQVSCFGACDGEIFTTITNGTAPYNILWSSGGTLDDEFNVCAGNDTLIVLDAAGCRSSAIYELTEPEQLGLDVVDIVSVACGNTCDGVIEVTMQGGTAPYTYAWSTGASGDSIGDLCSGTYGLTVTDSNGCVFSTNINVGGPEPIVIALDSIDAATCSNIGCLITDTFEIGSVYEIEVTAQADTTVCPDTRGILVSGTFTGGGGTRWLSASGIILDNGVQTFVDATQDTNMFVFEGTNNLCVSRDTMYVYQSAGPGLDAGPNKVIEPGESVVIGGDPTSAAGSAVTWSVPNDDISSVTDANPTVYPLQTKVFYVTATDVEGCFGMDSVIITVERLIDPVGGFSPNGDGVNDDFFIDKIWNYPNAIVQIVNRWGNPIFTSSPGYTTPWNGTFNGNALPHGTYYYVIDLKDANVPDPITGPVTLLK